MKGKQATTIYPNRSIAASISPATIIAGVSEMNALYNKALKRTRRSRAA